MLFSDETRRVVKEIYKTNSSASFSYILNYFYSKSSRIKKSLPIITEHAKKEMRTPSFTISHKLLLSILNGFNFMIYSFDTEMIVLFNSCIENITSVSQTELFLEIFETYFEIVRNKPYKNELQYTKLLESVVKIRDLRFLRAMIKMKEIFLYNYEMKYRIVINHILKECEEISTEQEKDARILKEEQSNLKDQEDKTELLSTTKTDKCTVISDKIIPHINLLVTTSNFLNIPTLYSLLLELCSKSNFNVVPFLEDHLLLIREVNLLLMTNVDLNLLEFITEDINMDNDDLIPSFLDLINLHYADLNITKYFGLFVKKNTTLMDYFMIKKMFKSDLTGETPVYNKDAQCVVFGILFDKYCTQCKLNDIEDGKSKFIDILCDIYFLVECFRDVILAIIKSLFPFQDFFVYKLRNMYFMTRNETLRDFLKEKFRCKKTALLLENVDNYSPEEDLKAYNEIFGEKLSYEINRIGLEFRRIAVGRKKISKFVTKFT